MSSQAENPFRYVYSPALDNLLRQTGVSLLISTYQACKLAVVRMAGGRASTLLRTFERPMGVAVRPDRIAVGAKNQIWVLRATTPDASGSDGAGGGCFLPRSSHVTGDIRVHEMAWAGDDLWFVNTRFSCLCTLDAEYSFTPRWRPSFISSLAPEDRCHLNGLALAEGRPKLATALGETDEADGWRKHKESGGIVIDIPSGEIIARGLSMPHSPRCVDGKVWLLDSGTGRVVVLDPATGKLETVAALPGYTRGLAFHGRYAFVGLSRIRETATFGGLPISERDGELQCGVWAIDVESGQTIPLLRFERGVEEIFAVDVLPFTSPTIVGFRKETIDDTFVIPPIDP